jgi:hypothetical protein
MTERINDHPDFHEEQVQIWANEILGALSVADLLKVPTYDEKAEAHHLVEAELVSIGRALIAQEEA